MRRQRRTKILATLGPSSSSPDMIEKLAIAGADLFRINMSHTNHSLLRTLVANIRSVEAKLNRSVGILADLQGPKLRVGEFAGGSAMLGNGTRFTLDNDPEPGDESRVHLPHPEILSSLEAGHTLILDDGKVRLKAVNCTPERAICDVVVGGKLSNRKGVSLPDTTLPMSAMTAKDREDLTAILQADVDWIALSFVQRPEDILEVKAIAGEKVGIMAKIEKPQALQHLGAIVDVSDAIMVARGDLGVELAMEKVPAAQKTITRLCRGRGTPVVVATQMLESMISAPVPTRAEVSDVSTAVFDGADAIMLSAESAAGQYPVEAVAMMNRIAEEIETDRLYRSILDSHRAMPEATGADAMAAAARQVAETLELSAIVCWTSSGKTALRVAHERPRPLIVALTPSAAAARRLTLTWGVHCVVAADARDSDDMVNRACRFAYEEGFAEAGHKIIIVAGIPFGKRGGTNLLRLATVTKSHEK